MDTGLIYGQYVPIVIKTIVAIMLIEAGSNVDEETMSKLPGTYIQGVSANVPSRNIALTF